MLVSLLYDETTIADGTSKIISSACVGPDNVDIKFLLIKFFSNNIWLIVVFKDSASIPLDKFKIIALSNKK